MNDWTWGDRPKKGSGGKPPPPGQPSTKKLSDMTMPTLTPGQWMWVGGSLLMLVSIVFGGIDNIKTMNAEGDRLSSIRQQNQSKASSMMLIQNSVETDAEFAESLFRTGCTFLVATEDPTIAITLSPGEPVLDSHTGRPLPDGHVVCDTSGNAAVIANGVIPVEGIVFTGNKEVVRQSMLNQGWTFKTVLRLMLSLPRVYSEQAARFW